MKYKNGETKKTVKLICQGGVKAKSGRTVNKNNYKLLTYNPQLLTPNPKLPK
jgi:hypothetical protein